MKGLLIVIASSAVLVIPAMAKGTAEITFLKDSTGVAAEAHTYVPPERQSTPQAPASAAPNLAPVAGPALVPLAGMLECGHDPRWAGGLTCALPAVENDRVAGKRVRPERESPETIGRRLADKVIALAPKPQLRMAPRGRGLTGLASFFWLAERPRRIQAQAGVGGITVTAQARPVEFVWRYGDGATEVTRHHGRRWTRKRPGNIDHVYETKERYRVTIEVVWEARWRIGVGAWRTLGYFSNSDAARYRVRELVPVLVRSN